MRSTKKLTASKGRSTRQRPRKLPDAAAKVSLAAWRLAGAIVDDVRDLLPEVANNFGEGKIGHGDLVTLRHVLELVERLPTNVAPIEFDILARGAKEAIVSLLRGALEYVGHLNLGSTTIRPPRPHAERASCRPTASVTSFIPKC